MLYGFQLFVMGKRVKTKTLRKVTLHVFDEELFSWLFSRSKLLKYKSYSRYLFDLVEADRKNKIMERLDHNNRFKKESE